MNSIISPYKDYFDPNQPDLLKEDFWRKIEKNYKVVKGRLKGIEKPNRTYNNSVISALEYKLFNFFLPDDENARGPYAFGTVDIKGRIKSEESIKDLMHNKPSRHFEHFGAKSGDIKCLGFL